MSVGGRTGLAVVAAFALLVVGWGPITTDSSALLSAMLAVGLVVGAGAVVRLLGGGSVAVLLGQVLALLAAALAVVALPLGWWGVTHIDEVFADGLAEIRTGTAPLEGHLGVTLALVVFVAALALLADLLTVTLERPGYVILPLLGLFLVPALGLAAPIEFHHVARFGVGVGLVLAASSPHLADRRRGVRAATWGLTAAVVLGSLGLTSVVAERVPVSAARPLGPDQLQMTNPALDLKRNLTQGSPQPVLAYTTDQPTGAYLRLATLTSFTVGGFGLDAVRVSTGRLPDPPGLKQDAPRRTTHVQVSGFASEWLPTPYAPVEVDAPGSWGFADSTLDIMAMARDDRTTATRDLSYRVVSVDVRPDDEQIRSATSSELAGQTALVTTPDQMPPRIAALADELTAGAATAGEQALALEQFLRSDHFEYSTAHAAGDSMKTLDDFLFTSRSGYCEQFAGAMVAMARSLGIPSRIAVGFTPGRHEDGVWRVSSRDMHTWPELWLDGWGWVAFEPTPGSGVPTATTEPPTDDVPEPTIPGEVEPTIAPEQPDTDPDPVTPPDQADPAASDALATGALFGLLFVLLLGVALPTVPALLRWRRRRTRLAGNAPPRLATLAAWDEVRDTASDLGIAWPAASPRYAAEELADGLPADAADSLRRLAESAERAMFDDPDAYGAASDWAPVVREVSGALRAASTTGTRVRATWWPRSMWRRD